METNSIFKIPSNTGAKPSNPQDIIGSSWKTEGWDKKSEYFHKIEETVYWEEWASIYFNQEECIKIGNSFVIKKMAELWKALIANLNKYVEKEKLTSIWKKELDQFNEFSIALDQINMLSRSILFSHAKDICNIQNRVFELKSIKIYNSITLTYYKDFYLN